MPGSLMLPVLLAGLGLAAAQKPTEIKQSELKNLVKPTEGADLAKSFRCGVFYIDPKEPPPEEGGSLVLTSPSLSKKRAAEGLTIGQDICQHLKNTVKAPFVGKNSKKFPDGAEFGMYSNACGVPEWTYTGVK